MRNMLLQGLNLFSMEQHDDNGAAEMDLQAFHRNVPAFKRKCQAHAP